MNGFAGKLLTVFVLASTAWAQAPPVTDEAFLRAALVVKAFDHYAAACHQRRGFNGAEAATVDAWQRANGVEHIRARLPELERHPAQKLQLDQAVATMVKLTTARGARDCAAAVALARAPDAQFAKVAPQLLAEKSAGESAPAAAAAPAASVAPKAQPAPRASSHADVLAQIDSFAFNTRTIMSVGGFLTTDVFPIVLLRNGEAMLRVEALTYPGGLTAHKRAKPGDWTQWRRAGGDIQIATKKGWEKLPFAAAYSALPDGFRLNGLYRRLGGSGNVAIGGSEAVTAWSDYRFSTDGQVERGGGAGARAQAGSASVVTRSAAPNQRGRYRVDGLLLHIDYDDGSREQRILIADPKPPIKAIWLDGTGYVLRGERAGTK